ncbi:hypothetical protein AURDEDRAFT_110433 [Auricularia subglabra TFB-10046 SS5]|nr:hypothetical protein AURDEDRAFT_110433 [Auricularia subglabra TFB-10046 SS5]
MQEREFQNMFTFCSGFEAATLKIPNKDSNAYGANNAPQGPAARPNGFGPTGYPQAQIGYAGDGFATEQGVVTWPPSGHDEHFGRPQEPAIQAPTVPPRKQIIGFAKFKTRAEALEARDVLQGKRIDIEKGAVLKAEMAKKNLHTKRGVGPLGIPMSLVGTGATVAPDTLAGLGAINGLPAGMGASEALTQRERELGAIGAMGLAGVASRSRDRPDDVEEKLRRATLAGPVVTVAYARREQDDKERRQRESDAAAKMRGYDAFYSVPAQPRPSGAPAQPAENTPMSAYPFPASAGGSAVVQPFSSQDLFAPVGTAATWGHGATKTDRFGQSRAVGLIGPPRPPSDPQSSPPPAETSTSSASTIGSIATITAADPMSPAALSPAQPSSQLPPLMLPLASRAYSPPSGEHGVGGDVRSVPASSGSSVTGSQGSENGDLGRSVVSGGTPHDPMSPPQPASPVSGGSSVTTNANMRPNVTDQNPPINTLYVGNLPTSPPPGYPPNQLEESLRMLFQRCPGFRKLCFRQKSNGPMCFVEFEDVQYASRAMQDLYGDTLNGLVKNGIRLSYSKNPLGVRTQPAGPVPNGRQEPPHPGPIGIQEAFNGRHLQSPTSLTMPIEIGHSRSRAEEVPGMYNTFAASPPSRFFPSPPPGPHARPAFSPLMAQQPQYARPPTQHVYAPAPVPGFHFGPGALSPSSPPPVGMPPSVPNDSIDDRYMSPRDFGTHAMSPSPGLEVSRAA